MNARVIAGVLLALLFLIGSAQDAQSLYFVEFLGSIFGISLYLRANVRRSRWRLLFSSIIGAALGGLVAIWAMDGDAFAFGEVLGQAIVAGIPMAACAELIITGRAKLRRCPFCAKEILVEAKVCRYCSRDVEPIVSPAA